MNWFAAELHCHTLHSDGNFTVDELKTKAKQHELKGIALTDHNTISGWAELSDETEKGAVAVLKGIEWTTFFGHMLVMDCPSFVDWRDALPENIDEKIREVRSHGGLVCIAHPFELGSPMCTGCFWDYHVHKWENVNCIEVWSEAFPSIKTSNQRAVELWNSVLDKGYHIAATHGKDWHKEIEETVPGACTYLGTDSCELTPAEMKNALSSGRTAITMGPLLIMEAAQGEIVYQIGSVIDSGKTTFNFTVDISARSSQWEKFDLRIESVRLITNGGKITAERPFENNSITIEITAASGWYRGELWGSAMGKSCCLAMTSPIYSK